MFYPAIYMLLTAAMAAHIGAIVAHLVRYSDSPNDPPPSAVYSMVVHGFTALAFLMTMLISLAPAE